MAITPTGPISVPKHLLREMVAGLPSFQAILAAANFPGAPADRVFLNAARFWEVVAPRPFAVVSLPDNSNEFVMQAGGAQHVFRPAGTLWLGLTTEAGDDPYGDDSATRFDNFAGAIWMELADLAAADAQLPITQFGWAMPPRITRPGDGSDYPYWQCIIEVPWQ